MIELRNVSLKSHGRDLLDGLSWQLPDPGLYLLLGGTGSGKSLLSRILAGRQKPSAGQVLIDGQPLYRWLLGYQEPVFLAQAELELPAPETVEGHLESELRNAGARSDGLGELWPVLEAALPGGRRARMSELAHGQQLLVQVALAASINSRLVILDGHLTYLDREACATAASLLASAAAGRERFLLLTAGRVAAEFPVARSTYRLAGGLPLRIQEVRDAAVLDTGLQVPHSERALRVYFTDPNSRHLTVTSTSSFSVLSRLEDGLRIRLEGSLDQALAELAEHALTPYRLEWELPNQD